MKYPLLFALILFCSSHSPAQVITTVAGNGNDPVWNEGIPATDASAGPMWVVADNEGGVYFTDFTLNAVRYVDPAGIIHFVAGNGVLGYEGDGGPATDAQLGILNGVALDSHGDLYVADNYNNCVRKVSKSTGTITTYAGNGTNGYSGIGGPATNASIWAPKGLCFDALDNLYIALSSSVIYKVDTSGMLTLVAGIAGSWGYNGDNIRATDALLNTPSGIVWRNGELFFTELGNKRVRRVDKLGFISTVAGNGTYGYSGNGGPATDAMIALPIGLAIDKYGNLYIGESRNDVIRKISSDGIISIAVGTHIDEFSPDGTPATLAKIAGPQGLAIDAHGGLYFAEVINKRLRYVDNMVGFNSPAHEHPLTIYPNPSSGVFNVSLGEPGTGTTLQLIDATGKRCYKAAITTKNSQHQPALPCGTYLLSITDADGMLYTQQLVIR
jgi:trimeric autotransporter adhesin